MFDFGLERKDAGSDADADANLNKVPKVPVRSEVRYAESHWSSRDEMR